MMVWMGILVKGKYSAGWKRVASGEKKERLVTGVGGLMGGGGENRK